MVIYARYWLHRNLRKHARAMSSRGTALWLAVTASTICPAFAQAPPALPNAGIRAPALPLPPKEVKVLERGPVHEAFAEPLELDAAIVGPAIPQAPPADIEEAPAELRPDDDRAAWIGGYWAWSDELNDFIWVSGVWRNVPPGREWRPGYWSEARGGGFQWISGYWAVSDQDPAQFLPAPPATLELGPSSPQPDANFFWIPGCWRWQAARYMWQPGYWYAAQPRWVWIPHHYVATPAGCIFVPGYWDYEAEERGWLFAPVIIPRHYVGQIGFVYRPLHIVDSRLLLAAMFLDTRHGHYCFGVYDAGAIANLGLRRWCDPWGNGRARYYDPLAAHYIHHHGGRHEAWAESLRSDYDRLVKRTIQVERQGANGPRLIRHIEHIAHDGNQIVRTRTMSTQEGEKWKLHGRQIAEQGAHRKRDEATPIGVHGPSRTGQTEQKNLGDERAARGQVIRKHAKIVNSNPEDSTRRSRFEPAPTATDNATVVPRRVGRERVESLVRPPLNDGPNRLDDSAARTRNRPPTRTRLVPDQHRAHDLLTPRSLSGVENDLETTGPELRSTPRRGPFSPQTGGMGLDHKPNVSESKPVFRGEQTEPRSRWENLPSVTPYKTPPAESVLKDPIARGIHVPQANSDLMHRPGFRPQTRGPNHAVGEVRRMFRSSPGPDNSLGDEHRPQFDPRPRAERTNLGAGASRVERFSAPAEGAQAAQVGPVNERPVRSAPARREKFNRP